MHKRTVFPFLTLKLTMAPVLEIQLGKVINDGLFPPASSTKEMASSAVASNSWLQSQVRSRTTATVSEPGLVGRFSLACGWERQRVDRFGFKTVCLFFRYLYCENH